MKLNYTEGFYNISFFNINIATEEELTRDVIEKNKASFIHEFIHYLQDLVLTYNIRYSLSNIRWFSDILQSARESGIINRPFNAWSSESCILKMQFLRGFGANQIISSASEIGIATSDYEVITGYDGYLHKSREHRVYEYVLPVFEHDKSNTIEYRLGARDILEYIAYKIGHKNFPDESSAPQFPYKTIDLIFNKYGLEDVSDDIRICIAERCLYNDMPIHFLFSAVLSNEDFKRYIVNSDYERIYNCMLSGVTVTRDGQRELLSAKRQRRLIQFANELQTLYDGFGEIKKWILKVNSFVEDNLSERFIFSDIYKMSMDELLSFVNKVILNIGIPLVINSKEKYISICANDIQTSEFIQFYILQRFIYFIGTNAIQCPIHNFCKANGGKCNANCILDKDFVIHGNANCHFRKFLENYELLNVKILCKPSDEQSDKK